jgi:hypothetical protein
VGYFFDAAARAAFLSKCFGGSTTQFGIPIGVVETVKTAVRGGGPSYDSGRRTAGELIDVTDRILPANKYLVWNEGKPPPLSLFLF